MKPRLLIVELWGMGDLIIATPFIRAAAERYAVTVAAKPFARELQPHFWPGVEVKTFVAPWTAFKGKYRLWRWPWLQGWRLINELRRQQFDVALSARWDPRDHVFIALIGARRRLGFSRLRSGVLLTTPVTRPDPRDHRYAYWRKLSDALDLQLPSRNNVANPRRKVGHAVLVHTGAGQAIRVWPLERYWRLIQQLRSQDHEVVVACDPDQRAWWREVEPAVCVPTTINELLQLIEQAKAFVGNDSGPGHLAAFCGVPTFTIFGPQLHEWFAPMNPHSEWVEGEACPYKPCSDYCKFDQPICITRLSEELVMGRVKYFLEHQLEWQTSHRPHGRPVG